MSPSEVRIKHNDPQRPSRAQVWLDGVEISSILSSYDVHCEAGKRPVVTLDIPSTLLRNESTATVKLAKRARDTLVSLGWTPPAEREA